MDINEQYKNVPPEVLSVEIEETSLSTRAKTICRWNRIITLEDLLSTEYKDIKKFRSMGKITLAELADYVHQFGFTLLNEEEDLEKVLADKKKNGVKLLEDEGFGSDIYSIFYRNRIYTLEDLKNIGLNVYELSGIGPLKKKKIGEKLEELGIELCKQDPEVLVNYAKNNGQNLVETPFTEAINKLNNENEIIDKRIKVKEALLKELLNLQKEQEKLLKYERGLDSQIEQLKSGNTEQKNTEEKSSYVKK